MPTESAIPADQSSSTSSLAPPDLKCSLCGSGASSPSTSFTERRLEDVVILSDPIERVCGGCARNQISRRDDVSADAQQVDIGAELDRGRTRVSPLPGSNSFAHDDGLFEATMLSALPPLSNVEPVPIPFNRASRPKPVSLHSQSLPSRYTQPWNSKVRPLISEFRTKQTCSEDCDVIKEEEGDALPNPLLDVSRTRLPNQGRGALFPGSIFKGTQTSGRSAYEVEVRILDVNFPASTLSGYLSISHLTDAHPYLTTFFTGEIIGPNFGFITGSKYGATEHDDMRHWGRFEQFRRPATRADMVRPELFFRDPLPDRTRGETRGKERDFVFLRIKERFLVPDHKVRDISGASFAGFYYAMVDLAPMKMAEDPLSPTSPTIKSPLTTYPNMPRRTSSSGPPTRPGQTRRRQSSSKFTESVPVRGEATIRGYYFHSLNQEPFQELFLTHVPSRSSSTMEMR